MGRRRYAGAGRSRRAVPGPGASYQGQLAMAGESSSSSAMELATEQPLAMGGASSSSASMGLVTEQPMAMAGSSSSVASMDLTAEGAESVNLAIEGEGLEAICSVMSPIGGGNLDIDIIWDGVYADPESEDSQDQYDTFHGPGHLAHLPAEEHPTPEPAWIGFTFTEEYTFTHLVFQEGMHFGDGGWFEIGSLKVQVLIDDVWTDATGFDCDPTYAGDNDVNWDIYTITIDPTAGTGIRLYGNGGGSNRVISCAELEPWGYGEE